MHPWPRHRVRPRKPPLRQLDLHGHGSLLDLNVDSVGPADLRQRGHSLLPEHLLAVDTDQDLVPLEPFPEIDADGGFSRIDRLHAGSLPSSGTAIGTASEKSAGARDLADTAGPCEPTGAATVGPRDETPIRSERPSRNHRLGHPR